MITKSKLRPQVGVILVLVFALVSGVGWIRKAVQAYRSFGKPDEISEYERRLAPLRARLPRTGVVGYLSDPVPQGASLTESRAEYKHYLLTQYALAPVLVARHPRAGLVIGNFHEPSSAAQAAQFDLKLVADFGDGVLLFSSRTTE